MTVISITLPWPPSVNTYWRHIAIKGKPRTLISAHGHTYRAAVLGIAPRLRLCNRLAVHIVVRPPDRRTRDLDNLPKAILDSLTHAGVWIDDSQIDDLRITRAEIAKGGGVVVHVREITDSRAPARVSEA